LEENDIQEVLDSNTAELTDEGLEHIIAFWKPEDEDSDTVVGRLQLNS
jgi:hypothetical protein